MKALRLVKPNLAPAEQKFQDVLIPPGYEGAELICSEIAGYSLEPKVRYGDVALIAKGEPVISGDLIAVNISNHASFEGTAFLVRYLFYYAPGGWIRLQSADREEWPDIIATPEQYEIVGKVIRVDRPEVEPFRAA